MVIQTLSSSYKQAKPLGESMSFKASEEPHVSNRWVCAGKVPESEKCFAVFITEHASNSIKATNSRNNLSAMAGTPLDARDMLGELRSPGSATGGAYNSIIGITES